MRRTLAFVVALLVLALVGGEQATATHSWNGYHWSRPADPFTVPLGDNLSPSWDPYLVTASTDWSQSTVLDTLLQAGAARSKQCLPTTGTVQVCNGSYGRNGWLGLAQIWLSGAHIVQGAVKVNDTYFSSATYNNKNEKLHVVCQEVGHTFGLGHQDESGASLNTCMDYYHNTSDADTKSTHPNQHDYDELVTIYTSHYEAASGASSGTAGAAARVPGAAEDGTPFGAARGRGSWYVQELGPSRFLLTHVFWAPTGN